MNRKELISEIDIQISEFKNILKSEKNHDILEEKILDLLCEIDGKITEIVGNKDSIQKEIIFHRFIAMHLIDTKFTSIDDFLDDYLAIAYQEIQERTILLSHDLFIPGNSNIEKGDTNKKNKITVKKAGKNKILKRVLHDLWYKPSEIIKVSVENLNANRMRKIPYNIYHLDKSGLQKTILICDEIWQATFVYEGIIDTENFQNIEKWETIWDSQALKIIYSKKSFESSLEIALSDTLTFEEKEGKIENEDEEQEDNIKKEQYTIEELKKLKIPESVLWEDKYWRDYVMKINEKYSNKILPLSLKWLDKILQCEKKKLKRMEALWMRIREKYTIQEIRALNVSEEVLWNDRKWKIYAEEINKILLYKELPTSLRWLATILWCKAVKKDLKEALWMILKKDYTISELKALNIPEEVLWDNNYWKSYAEKINKEYPDKKLPTSLEGLAWLLWCENIKSARMKALWMIVKEKYTISELKALNIPEWVLWHYKQWKPYVEEINKEYPEKELPASLDTLASILLCKPIKVEMMQALWMIVKEKYTLSELKALNIPEEVLWYSIKWKVYSEKINKEYPDKKLPTSLEGLAWLLWCKMQKKIAFKEVLWIK